LVQNCQKWFKNYCPQINQIKQIFVVNNYQQWFKNYCPQINQIKQIFVVNNYQQLKTIFGNPLQRYNKKAATEMVTALWK